MLLTGRGGLAGMGIALEELGQLGYRIVADPSTPLFAAYAAWKQVYRHLADGFGGSSTPERDWAGVEEDLFGVIGLEKLLDVERRTVERGEGG